MGISSGRSGTEPAAFVGMQARRSRKVGLLLMFTALAALAAMTVWLVSDGSRAPDLVRTETGNPGTVGTSGVLDRDESPTPVAGGIIHELETITGANDGHQFVGRRVEITVPVQQHLNDEAFWAGMGDNRLLVVRDNRDAAQRQRGEPAPGPVDAVRPAQQAIVFGTIQRVPDAEAMQRWGLSDADRAELMERRIYLRADDVSVTS